MKFVSEKQSVSFAQHLNLKELTKLKHLPKLFKLVCRFVFILAVIWCTIIFVYAFQSRKKADLQLWHRAILDGEFSARDHGAGLTFKEYLDLEDILFKSLETTIYQRAGQSEELMFSRYYSPGPCNPDNFPQNFNRSFELVPEDILGGVLLIHGLTDSPYSMQYLAELFYRKGFYVLALRMPGHGTVPAALTRVSWRDWAAAVKVGARHVSAMAGEGQPFYVAGYSSGGLLAVNYSLGAISNGQLAQPDRLLLFSPAIGVTKFAGLSESLQILGFIPYFEKSKWKNVSPEYDPFKYASFPLNASRQLYNLSKNTQDSLAEYYADGKLSRLPSITTFQSAVDSTVIAEDTVSLLYGRLSSGDDELIFFDVNRNAYLKNFLKSKHDSLLANLSGRERLGYDLTIITNETTDTLEVAAKTKLQGQEQFGEPAGLSLSWPKGVYSLSHIAILFPLDDPLYGIDPKAEGIVHFGNLALRGEKDLLKISAGDLMRIRCNPFYEYMMRHIGDMAAEDMSSNLKTENK